MYLYVCIYNYVKLLNTTHKRKHTHIHNINLCIYKLTHKHTRYNVKKVANFIKHLN